MTFTGNHGVCVEEVQRDGKIYYVCTDGAEFFYDQDKGMLIGNDGIEYTIDNENNRLICNNGNDAHYFSADNGIVAEFDDGKVYIENID